MYHYRLPIWFVALVVLVLFGPLLFAQGRLIQMHGVWSWHSEWGWALGIVGAAIAGTWFLRKAMITIDSERMRFLGGTEFRWEDARQVATTGVAGLKYVRVTTEDGRVLRILLNPPGGGDFGRLVLEKPKVDRS